MDTCLETFVLVQVQKKLNGSLCFLLQALYTQYLQFKEHEIPLKENEKTKIKNLYKMLEVNKRKTEPHVTSVFVVLFSVVIISLVFVLHLTDVDRVWTYSVTPGSPPE